MFKQIKKPKRSFIKRVKIRIYNSDFNMLAYLKKLKIKNNKRNFLGKDYMFLYLTYNDYNKLKLHKKRYSLLLKELFKVLK